VIRPSIVVTAGAAASVQAAHPAEAAEPEQQRTARRPDRTATTGGAGTATSTATNTGGQTDGVATHDPKQPARRRSGTARQTTTEQPTTSGPSSPGPAITPATVASTTDGRPAPVTSLPPIAPPLSGSAVPATPAASTGPVIIGTAAYFVGSVALSHGSRYAIEVDGNIFRLRGPFDTTPQAAAFEFDISRLEARAIGDRLVITEPALGDTGLMLAFVSVKGTTAEGIASDLINAISSSGRPLTDA
jgi:hypothetical protein